MLVWTIVGGESLEEIVCNWYYFKLSTRKEYQNFLENILLTSMAWSTFYGLLCFSF